jgi:hypothetical protein
MLSVNQIHSTNLLDTGYIHQRYKHRNLSTDPN